jgi:hypothetical protein
MSTKKQPIGIAIAATVAACTMGSWSSAVCNTAGTAFGNGAAGNVASFGIEELDAVGCSVTQLAGSLSAMAKLSFC